MAQQPLAELSVTLLNVIHVARAKGFYQGKFVDKQIRSKSILKDNSYILISSGYNNF